MRKKIASLALVSILFCFISVSAHPGRTDANGGHYNRSTGEYHYHHGYPEHQHPNGVCPYEVSLSTPASTAKTQSTAHEGWDYQDAYMEAYMDGWAKGWNDAREVHRKDIAKIEAAHEDELTSLREELQSNTTEQVMIWTIAGALLCGVLVYFSRIGRIKNLEKQVREAQKVANKANTAYSELLESVEKEKRHKKVNKPSAPPTLPPPVNDCPELDFGDLDDYSWKSDDELLFEISSVPVLLDHLFNTIDTPEQAERYNRAIAQNMKILSVSGDSKSAQVLGTTGEIYHTSLVDCNCEDFKRRHLPCKHMYLLGIEIYNRQKNKH